MAEKKKNWFGRLFTGKKNDTSTNVDATETAPETKAPELEGQREQITVTDMTTSQSVSEVVQENVIAPTAEVKADRVIDTVDKAAKEEIHEANAPLDKVEIAHTIHTEEAVKPQHHFIDEVAQDAKIEIKAAHTQFKEISSTIDTVTKAEEVIVETLEKLDTITPIQTKTPTIIEETNSKAVLATTEIVTENTPAASIIETPIKAIIEDTVQEALDNALVEVIEETEALQEKPQKKGGLFSRLSSKLSKTRNNLTGGIADLFLGKKEINEDILEELETRLLMADVGIKVTDQMLTTIRDSVSRKSLSNVDELFTALKVQMKNILEPVSKPLIIDTSHRPYVILMIGVNGVGKTTTIGKLAKKFQAEGKSVMLAAGDTFRAAAVEQLEIWGERNKIPVVSQKEGADPASVIFDAMESAKSKKVDILIADTAGRLHTDSGLMQELAKINRVIKRHDETAPQEVMLVVDASTGQNALNQARQFNTTVPLSGITFTKLDGTAKGGIIFAIAEELNIPIRFIGVGESIDDLRPFDSEEFVDALISTEKAS